MSKERSATLDALIAELLDAAHVLVKAVVDPVALDAAPLQERAKALAVVDRFLKDLHAIRADAADEPDAGQPLLIEWGWDETTTDAEGNVKTEFVPHHRGVYNVPGHPVTGRAPTWRPVETESGAFDHIDFFDPDDARDPSH